MAQQGTQHARVADQQQTFIRIPGLPAFHTGHSTGLHGGEALSLRRRKARHVCSACRMAARPAAFHFGHGQPFPQPQRDLAQSRIGENIYGMAPGMENFLHQPCAFAAAPQIRTDDMPGQEGPIPVALPFP